MDFIRTCTQKAMYWWKRTDAIKKLKLIITNAHKCVNNVTNFKKSKFKLFIHKICSHGLKVLVEEACSWTLDSAGF